MIASFAGIIAAWLTVGMLVTMLVFVVRLEVRMYRKGKQLDAMVSDMQLESPRRRTAIRQRVKSTPPAAPSREMAFQDTTPNPTTT